MQTKPRAMQQKLLFERMVDPEVAKVWDWNSKERKVEGKKSQEFCEQKETFVVVCVACGNNEE